MNTELLKNFMNESGIKAEDMATAIGVDVSTWYRKMQKNGDSFTVKEMNTMIKSYKITTRDAAAIFFNEKLA